MSCSLHRKMQKNLSTEDGNATRSKPTSSTPVAPMVAPKGYDLTAHAVRKSGYASHITPITLCGA